MASTRGRQVVVPLTNKSGGAVAAGDVVVVDTTNDEAFTTSTAGAVTGGVGIAQDAIANNEIGRVLVHGFAALVNVNASVTRGNYGKTHTVAKQATDAGASRVAGAFCQFLKGGTTPSARVFAPDLGAAAGNVAADAIWDAAGDLAVGTGADTAARLAKGAAGTVPTAGASTLAYAFPPGYELDYVQKTTDTSITAGSEGAADTAITGSAIAYDGSTVVLIECYAFGYEVPASQQLIVVLYDGSGSIGTIGQFSNPAGSTMRVGGTLSRRLTPSNATHTYSIRAWVTSGTGKVLAGAGGSGAASPAFIRITKV